MSGKQGAVHTFHGENLTEKPDRECGHKRLRPADAGCEICDIDWLLETGNVTGLAARQLRSYRREAIARRANSKRLGY